MLLFWKEAEIPILDTTFSVEFLKVSNVLFDKRRKPPFCTEVNKWKGGDEMKNIIAIIAAVGQWAGAIATFTLAFITIGNNQPKLKLQVVFAYEGEFPCVYISVINRGNVTVSIVDIVIWGPIEKNYRHIDANYKIESGIKVSLNPLFTDEFIENGITDNREIMNHIKLVDNLGRNYFCYNGIKDKLYRKNLHKSL